MFTLSELTDEEKKEIAFPRPPVKPDLIAHDSDGHLIGYEECTCPEESKQLDLSGVIWDEESPDWFGGSD